MSELDAVAVLRIMAESFTTAADAIAGVKSDDDNPLALARRHGFTAETVADQLNVSRQRVYQLLEEGESARARVLGAVVMLIQAKAIADDESSAIAPYLAMLRRTVRGGR